MELKANEFFIKILKTISGIIISPFIMIYLIIDGFLDIGSDLFDDILSCLKYRR